MKPVFNRYAGRLEKFIAFLAVFILTPIVATGFFLVTIFLGLPPCEPLFYVSLRFSFLSLIFVWALIYLLYE